MLHSAKQEIAPLLGISVRGVENHRYRLRQKMKLTQNDNLTETILKL
jgi:DNA-binding CsgD family transcriptional regulator